jgi:hypothetical protein
MPSLTEQKQGEIAEFIADLSDLSTLAIRGRCRRVVEKLLREHTVATAHAELTFYRNAARDEGTEEATKALRYLRLTRDDQKARNLATRAAVGVRRTTQIDVSKRVFIRNARAAILSDDWRKIIVGSAALTGRRTYEIATGSFTSDGNALIFDGQAKTRGAEGTTQGPYSIPVLGVPASDLVAAWNRLQLMRPDLSALSGHEFHDLAGSKLTAMTREVFADAFPNGAPKTKDLRAAYAAFCYESESAKRRKGGRGVSVIEYYAKILGHKLMEGGGSMDLTAASYDYVRVTK